MCFEFLESNLIALVVTREGARVVDLGDPDAVHKTIDRLRGAVMAPNQRGVVRPRSRQRMGWDDNVTGFARA